MTSSNADDADVIKSILLNNLGTKFILVMKFGKLLSCYKRKIVTKFGSESHILASIKN